MNTATTNLLFLGTSEDKPYLSALKDCIGAATCRVLIQKVETISEIIMYCSKHSITGIFSTSPELLARLLEKQNDKKKPSLDNYAGSLFKHQGVEIVFISPLKQFHTVPYGKFLTQRYLSKLTAPETWSPAVNFDWEILNASNYDVLYNKFSTANLIAVDIETFREGAVIRCVGYTAYWYSNTGSITSHSCVCALDSDYHLSIVQNFNALPAPKATQNGKYDNAYLLRYNAPLHNWYWDTATMFHCWYSELPKNLAFLGSFFVREAMYWKDLAATNDLHEYYLYNCRDHWTTGLIAIEWMLTAPDWAKKNYLMEFPLNYPAMLCEMTGVKRDFERLASARAKIEAEEVPQLAALHAMVGAPINPASPVQTKTLLKILGMGDVDSGDEAIIQKAMYMHPLNARVLAPLLEIRGLRKLRTTYLRTDADKDKGKNNGAKEFKGRILYSLNPHGTDTGRLASKEHHFWCGLNFQNIPRGDIVKDTIVSDDGWLFAEVDSEQAESRDTAHIAGDEILIAAVSGTDDFHSINCSSFFGVPYEKIYSNETKRVINKRLRDLAKRVNHGANYNMGEAVLVSTMGLERIAEAKKLLCLNKFWGPLQVAGYLLAQFHKTYPKIQGAYYPSVIQKITETKMLVGGRGWTRYCFNNPTKSKSALNSYVAHCPQSENAMRLNAAFMKVFYEIAMHPSHSSNFKLLAQIHDSIFFQFREGHSYLCEMVKERMELETTVVGADKKMRTYIVPAGIKAGADGKGAKYWSKTE